MIETTVCLQKQGKQLEKIDGLQNGNRVIQDDGAFMFGIDAVLLAHFACGGVHAGENVIDLGTGNGIIPLLMEKACGASHFTGLEIQEKSAGLAVRSVKLNSLEQKIEIVNGDIKNVASLFAKHSFNVAVSNPPYALVEQGKTNAAEEKTIARHELLCTLEDVVAAADYLLHSHGRFFMIHRPERLSDIFASLARHKLEPKRLQLVEPFEGEAANLVLIESRKDARPGLKLEPTLVVRYKNGEHKGEYTKEINKIYDSLASSKA